MKSKAWFRDHIGRTVYPTYFDKKQACPSKTHADGIRIENLLHALYLFNTQYENGTLYTDKIA